MRDESAFSVSSSIARGIKQRHAAKKTPKQIPDFLYDKGGNPFRSTYGCTQEEYDEME